MPSPALIDELKTHLIADLGLEDLGPEDIDPAAPLFVEGLGLDSIDAVEIVVMLERHYGIRLTEMESAKAAFASLNVLAEFIEANRSA